MAKKKKLIYDATSGTFETGNTENKSILMYDATSGTFETPKQEIKSIESTIQKVEPSIERQEITPKPTFSFSADEIKKETKKEESNGNLGGDLVNAGVQLGKGVLSVPEKIYDTILQGGSSKYNPGMYIADDNKSTGDKIRDFLQATAGTLGKIGEVANDISSLGLTKLIRGESASDKLIDDVYKRNKSSIDSKQSIAKELIEDNPTQKYLINDKLGYDKVLSDGRTVQETLDDNAKLIKSTNMGGQIMESIGAQLPSMMVGTGSGEIGSLGTMALQSYGSGLEEAYRNGATREEANRFGLMTAAIETATEKMFAGVGGVIGKGPLDESIEALINDKIKNKIAAYVVNYGLDMIGEGVEEVAADILNPIAKKLSYANEEELKKLYADENYLEDFLSGFLSAGVMKMSSAPFEIQNIRNQSQNNLPETHYINQSEINNSQQQAIYQDENTEITPLNEINLEDEQNNQNISLQEQLENQGTRIMENAIMTQDAMIDNFKSYLEENNIKNPTQKDISDSIIDTLEYDSELSQNEKQQLEKQYNEVIKQYLEEQSKSNIQENNIQDEILPNITKTNNETNIKDTIDSEIKQEEKNQQIKQSVNQEKMENNVKKSLLAQQEQNELEGLKALEESGLAETNDLNRLKELENKSKGITIKYSDLKTNNKFEDIKPIYYKYKNSEISNTNKKLIDRAKSIIEANKQGKRTIEQWKQIAEFIGANSNLKSSSDLQKLAMTTWFSEKPNNASNLNRQGKGYIPFAVQDWVNEIYKGAGVGTEVDNKRYNFTGNANLSFEKQIDNWKNGKIKPNEHLVVFKETPKLYKELGVEDNPITLISSKVDRIYNDSGKQNGEYHGLKELIKKLPEAISKPLNVVESVTDPNSIVIVTDLADKNNNIILVSLKIDKGTGQIDIDNVIKNVPANVVTSAYGKDTYDYQKEPINGNYDGWMKKNYDNDKIVYDIDDGIKKQRINGQWLQLPNSKNSFVKQNISQSNKNVKSDISNNIDMQENKNNTINENKKDDVITIKDNNKNVDLKKNKDNTYTRVNDNKTNEILPKAETENKKYKIGDKQVSNFYSNITEKSKFITEENRIKMMDNEELHYYDEITNKETLQNALDNLNENVDQKVGEFFTKSEFTPEDVATGWILVKRYQDAGNFDAMSNVIEKMREQGTKAGQTVQMYGILQRLTPEGMEYYSQKQLDNAYKKFAENKSKKQIDKYAKDFTLTAEEHQFIRDTMEKVENLTDEESKKVEVAKIVKMLSDKLPPERGQRLKAWMRISMLGNPKTQVRNVVGNAIIQPVNWVGDIFANTADKIMSKKTGKRTIGLTQFNELAKGTKKGFTDAVRDAKTGVDTRDINLNRFEENIGAKPFYEGHKSKALNKGAKVLNKTNQILSNVMSGGDRIFYQAIYDNSLQNQMKLNKTEVPTQEMMDIAEQEALSRTWNDSNGYTKAVLQIRNAMNKLNVKGYGLGDVLIPFAKTPANLTKAIVDYSPVGLARTILQDGKNYKNSLQNGQYNAQIQHKFADSLGKGFAGSLLYIAAYALAKSGIITGKSDDDKDVANFMRNTLGIQPYSVKIGNKSFTYDWAQPIAAPFAIMADAKRMSEKENQELSDIISSSVDSASNILLEQSFLSSIQDVFNSYEGPSAAIQKQIQSLPARATPTLFKQIADLIDPTSRQTYVKGDTGQYMKNQIQVKIPVASKDLSSNRDTLGREIKKYSGNDNKLQYAFNVFLNPANTNKGKVSEAAQEIYKVYQATGDKTIMPRQVGYSESIDGKTRNLTSKERNQFQKLSGELIEENVKSLVNSSKYKKMTDEDKASVINGIVNYSFNKAKSEVFDVPMSNLYKAADRQYELGFPISEYYINKVSK